MSLSFIEHKNGCKIVLEKIDDFKSTSIGVGFSVGSIHDPKEKSGISHYVEHMLFKGTKNRTMNELKEPIEKVGGILNGSTGRESVIYYAKIPHFVSVDAFEIIMDMIKNPLFDDTEMERERSVILEEMKMEFDDPYYRIHNMFIQNCWNDEYGRPIIGTADDVMKISKDDLLQFHDKFYRTNNLIISIAGRIESKLEDDIFSQLEDMKTQPYFTNTSPPMYKPKSPFLKEGRKDITQIHFLAGTKAPGKLDEGYKEFLVFDTLMGSGMSSRLFRKIREEMGLAYNISSEYIALKRAGLFLIYASTSIDKYDRLLELVKREIDDMRSKRIGFEEFKYGKERLIGEFTLSLESTYMNMIRNFDNVITYGKPIDSESWLRMMERIDYDEFLSKVSRYMENDWTFSIIGPSEFVEKVKVWG